MNLTPTTQHSIFHHSIAVDDLGAARRFYGEVLGCREVLPGKGGERRADYDFFGHHLALKLVTGAEAERQRTVSTALYVRHFGVFLAWDDWEALVARLRSDGFAFPAPPALLDQGSPLESASFQVSDPAGNGIEFKSARDLGAWFAQ